VNKIRYPRRTKTCPRCKKDKPATAKFFCPDKRGYICWCRRCSADRATEWGKTNHRRQTDTRFKRRYGLSIEEFDALVLQQNGKCAICGEAPKAVKSKLQGFNVDHDHKTKKVRGLLCFGCNTGIGCLRDNPSRLRSAADYLERM